MPRDLQDRVLLVEVPPCRDRAVQPYPDLWEDYREELRRGLAHQGRVNPRKFWRLSALGDTRVWRGDPESTSRVRASAVLLWDWSGSQAYFRHALVATLNGIGHALTSLGIQTWAAAYTTAEVIDEKYADLWKRRPIRTPRDVGTALFRVNDYGEAWDARRVESLNEVGMFATPTPWALGYVRQKVLAGAPQVGKKLVVVCTDGMSASPAHEDAEIRALRSEEDTFVVGVYCGADPKGGAPEALDYFMDLYRPLAFWVPRREDLGAAFGKVVGTLRGG